MNQRHYLLKGTFLLTSAGLISRAAGFFYKIFLSRLIGASEIGLFQLTLPVYSFCMAFACGGIQTALSRFTAETQASEHPSVSHRLLFSSLAASGVLSLSASAFLWLFSERIASRFLLEPRCELLLQILAVSLPFCVFHSCLCGYFTGRKRIFPTALSQVIEQTFRIGSVFLFFVIFFRSHRFMSASVMALGQFAGELAAAVFCLLYFCLNINPHASFSELHHSWFSFSDVQKLFSVSLPIGLNRMLLCLLQGVEASLLPLQLKRSGMSAQEALASYGILTGMALPLILFPTAVTSAVGTLLLPTVSEAKVQHHHKKLLQTIQTTILGAAVLGSFCLLIFLLCGNSLGYLLFQTKEAGIYLHQLSMICPFLYLNTAMAGILHGLGKTGAVFFWSILSILMRLLAVVFLVPGYGIRAYIYASIVSQFFTSCCTLFLLSSIYKRHKQEIS